jgi:hypothetical protein
VDQFGKLDCAPFKLVSKMVSVLKDVQKSAPKYPPQGPGGVGGAVWVEKQNILKYLPILKKTHSPNRST